MIKSPLVVLGAFETGLGVIRSLGELGYRVYCLDYKKDIASYSRYVKNRIISHPLEESAAFIKELIDFAKHFPVKPILFLTSDDFLKAVAINRSVLEEYFNFNILSDSKLAIVEDKFKLFQFCKKHNIAVPETFKLDKLSDINRLPLDQLDFPLIIKGADVNTWRSKIHGSKKGFKANNLDELIGMSKDILSKGVCILVQGIIDGPDTNHFKYCAYYSKAGKPLAKFTLKKIRQCPAHFGVGSVVESINDKRIIDLGENLFHSLGATGVVSAEFKLDERDGIVKLIEINARYWQQNYLATACGINFPLIEVRDLMGESVESQENFKDRIKWVNRYMDFTSFIDYRREGVLGFWNWRKSLKGAKVYPDFTWRDPIPALYEFGFGLKILRLPVFVYRKIFGHA